MPKISSYLSREPITPAPLPRVSPERMARGVGGAATLTSKAFETAAKFSETVNEARRKSELMRVQNSWKQGINDFLLELDGDTDYSTYGDRFEVFQKKLHGVIKEDYKGSVRDLDNFVERELLPVRYKVRHRANQGEIKGMEGQYFEDLTMATERGDRDFVEESTDTAIESGYLDPVKGQKAKEQALAKINYQEAWRDIFAAPNREEVLDIVKEAPITPGQKNALITAYDRETAFKEAQEEEQRVEARTETQDDFIARAYDVDNPLTHSEIDGSGLEPTGAGSKAFFHGLVDRRTEAVLKGKRSPCEQTDPKLLAKILLRENDPNIPPMSATEILGLVGIGLGVDTASSLIKTLNVRNTDVFKNTEAFLKIQFGYEGLLKGFGARPLGAVYYNNAMTEILVDLATTPLKGAKLRDKVYELAQPYLEEYWDASGKSSEDVDKTLRLMNLKPSPMSKLLSPGKAPPRDYDREYVPGKGWVE